MRAGFWGCLTFVIIGLAFVVTIGVLQVSGRGTTGRAR